MPNLQELGDDNLHRGIQFCETMIGKLEQDLLTLKKFCFADGAHSFYIDVPTNKIFVIGIMRIRILYKLIIHNILKIHVWAGILSDEIVGAVFLTQTLEGQIYGEPHLYEYCLHFQLDGVPSYYAQQTRQWLWLDQRYSEN